MWHSLSNVAKMQRFNVETFTEFALKHRDRFDLDDKNMVSTWFTDELIAAYRYHRGPSAILAERNEQIEAYRKRIAK
jgi:hypothetical protein